MAYVNQLDQAKLEFLLEVKNNKNLLNLFRNQYIRRENWKWLLTN